MARDDFNAGKLKQRTIDKYERDKSKDVVTAALTLTIPATLGNATAAGVAASIRVTRYWPAARRSAARSLWMLEGLYSALARLGLKGLPRLISRLAMEYLTVPEEKYPGSP